MMQSLFYATNNFEKNSHDMKLYVTIDETMFRWNIKSCTKKVHRVGNLFISLVIVHNVLRFMYCSEERP